MRKLVRKRLSWDELGKQTCDMLLLEFEEQLDHCPEEMKREEEIEAIADVTLDVLADDDPRLLGIDDKTRLALAKKLVQTWKGAY